MSVTSEKVVLILYRDWDKLGNEKADCHLHFNAAWKIAYYLVCGTNADDICSMTEGALLSFFFVAVVFRSIPFRFIECMSTDCNDLIYPVLCRNTFVWFWVWAADTWYRTPPDLRSRVVMLSISHLILWSELAGTPIVFCNYIGRMVYSLRPSDAYMRR